MAAPAGGDDHDQCLPPLERPFPTCRSTRIRHDRDDDLLGRHRRAALDMLHDAQLVRPRASGGSCASRTHSPRASALARAISLPPSSSTILAPGRGAAGDHRPSIGPMRATSKLGAITAPNGARTGADGLTDGRAAGGVGRGGRRRAARAGPAPAWQPVDRRPVGHLPAPGKSQRPAMTSAPAPSNRTTPRDIRPHRARPPAAIRVAPPPGEMIA